MEGERRGRRGRRDEKCGLTTVITSVLCADLQYAGFRSSLTDRCANVRERRGHAGNRFQAGRVRTSIELLWEQMCMYNLISGDYWRLSKLSTLRQVTWARSEPSRRPLPPFAEFTDQKKSGCNVSIPSLSKGSYQLSKEGPQKARNKPKTHPRSAPVPVLWAIIVEIIVNRPVKKKEPDLSGPWERSTRGFWATAAMAWKYFP